MKQLASSGMGTSKKQAEVLVFFNYLLLSECIWMNYLLTTLMILLMYQILSVPHHLDL